MDVKTIQVKRQGFVVNTIHVEHFLIDATTSKEDIHLLNLYLWIGLQQT